MSGSRNCDKCTNRGEASHRGKCLLIVNAILLSESFGNETSLVAINSLDCLWVYTIIRCYIFWSCLIDYTYLQHSRSTSPLQLGSSFVFQCIQFCSFYDTRYLFWMVLRFCLLQLHDGQSSPHKILRRQWVLFGDESASWQRRQPDFWRWRLGSAGDSWGSGRTPRRTRAAQY